MSRTSYTIGYKVTTTYKESLFAESVYHHPPVQYIQNQYVECSAGPMMVFKYLADAVRFIKKYYPDGSYVLIWKCRYKPSKIKMKERLLKTHQSFSEREIKEFWRAKGTSRTGLKVPEGTRLATQVMLLEQVELENCLLMN